MSNKSANMSTTSNGQNPNHRNVRQPAIPSNLEGSYQDAQFNSIGYYGDLIDRLDSSIKTVENVYKKTFDQVQNQQIEKQMMQMNIQPTHYNP